MIAKTLHIAFLFFACCNSVALAQLVSSSNQADSSRNHNEIMILSPDSLDARSIPRSVFYTMVPQPDCMDLGKGCLNEKFVYDKVECEQDWDDCRKGKEDCDLTQNLKYVGVLLKPFVQFIFYTHEMREKSKK